MKYKGIKKLYYSISEISEMLGIKQSVIRYWESEFKELKPQKNRAGNRIYKKDDIAILRMIHYYVHEKHLSIHEANEVITDLKNEGLYKRKLQELNKTELKPVPMDDEYDEESETDETDAPIIVTSDELSDEEETEQEEDFDSDEEETDDTDEEVGKPLFEIVTPTQETFIYPLDDLDKDNTDDQDRPSEDDMFISPVDREESEPEPEPMPMPEPEPVPESQPLKVVEPVKAKESDPELKELLKKISGNIRDIIDILNE